MFAIFYDQTASLVAVLFPQDASGGPVPTPGATTIDVPACVQQNTAPERSGKDSLQQRCKSAVTIFFGVSYAADPTSALAAVKGLGRLSRVVLQDGRIIVLDGPAFDRSGHGVVYEAAGQYTS